jgi:hypothetical protein
MTVEEAGWSETEWQCLERLWTRESGWTTPDTNPSSGAAGIPQALPPSKMGDGWESSVPQQIAWGMRYIIGRYGSACAALAHSDAHNYY